jgi:hypothetical protein
MVLASAVYLPVSAMAPKCMDGSSTGCNLTTVRYAARDEVFFSGFQGNPVSIDDQRVATLHDDHIFVVIVDMLRRRPGFSTRPERHLAALDPIEHVTLDTWSGLMGSGNLVRGIFHELRKVVHVARDCRTPTRDRASSGIAGALGIVCSGPEGFDASHSSVRAAWRCFSARADVRVNASILLSMSPSRESQFAKPVPSGQALYSVLNASIGSTEAARRAGSQAASNAQRKSKSIALPITGPSRGFTS